MINDENINLILDEISKNISSYIESRLSDEVDITDIKQTHGKRNDAPPWCKRGSFIYYLYDELGNIIYIGETGVSVKSRLFGDGSGAHSNKDWFGEVKTVKYYKNDEMNNDRRKLIERALIYNHNPVHNKD